MATKSAAQLVRDAQRLTARHEDDSDRADAAAWTAVHALQDARAQHPGKAAYREYLHKDVGLGVGESEGIARIFEDRDAFLASNAKAVAKVPAAQATTANLEAAHLAHLSHPQTRTDLMRTQGALPGAKDGEWGSLVTWLHDNELGLAKVVKAEAVGRMSLYISSGWAEKDLGPGAPGDAPRTPAADGLRHVFDQLRAGQPLDDQEMKMSLDARWNELFVPLAVKKVALHGTSTTTPIAFESGISAFTMDGKGTAESGGRVDAFIRDATDPHAWHMAFASSGEDSRKQGDQMTRHVGGVLNGIAVGAPPFEEEDRLVSINYYAPAIVSDERAQRLGLVDQRGRIRDSSQNAINSLALYAQLDDPYVRRERHVGDAVLATRHIAVGAGATTTGGPIDQVDPEEHARRVVGAIKQLADINWDTAIRKTGEGPIRDTILPLAMAAVDGMAKHYPETLPILRKAIPSITFIADAPGIVQTGQARDLGMRAMALKHDVVKPLAASHPLSDEDKAVLRNRIDDDRARDADTGLIATALRGRVDAQDEAGRTALHLAADRRDIHLAGQLLNRGARVDAVDDEGQTPLHVAAAKAPRTDKARADNAALIDLLAKRTDRDTVDLQDGSGQTALHLAATKGQDRSVMSLLKNGADSSLRDNRGELPRDKAEAYGTQVRSPTLRAGVERSIMVLDVATMQRDVQRDVMVQSQGRRRRQS